MRSALVFAVLALGALASGCGATSTASLSYGESARRDYERAMQAFADDDCLTAEPLFQNVVREYGYSRYAALAELRVADCELAQLHYSEAIRRYRAFVRARPTHVHIDYANFQIALAYFRQIPGDFFLSPPREERDQTPTRSALRVVRRFLREYGTSEHITEARRIERECLALLARHELYAAGFYLLRERPQATIIRLETLMREYSGSGLEPDALLLLGRTYLHTRDLGLAREAFENLRTNYPDSGLVVQAEAFLTRMDSGDIGGAIAAAEAEPIVVEDTEDDAEEEDAEEEEEPLPVEEATSATSGDETSGGETSGEGTTTEGTTPPPSGTVPATTPPPEPAPTNAPLTGP